MTKEEIIECFESEEEKENGKEPDEESDEDKAQRLFFEKIKYERY